MITDSEQKRVREMSGMGLEVQLEMTGMGMDTNAKVCCHFITKTHAADLRRVYCESAQTPTFAPTMPTSWVRCNGCKKFFTPRGHSQHVQRTHHASCRTNGQSIRPHLASRSSIQTATQSSNNDLAPSEARGFNQIWPPLPEHEATNSRDHGGFLVPPPMAPSPRLSIDFR